LRIQTNIKVQAHVEASIVLKSLPAILGGATEEAKGFIKPTTIRLECRQRGVQLNGRAAASQILIVQQAVSDYWRDCNNGRLIKSPWNFTEQ
jgi:hypothetical protein